MRDMEQDLRRLLRDERWQVEPAADAIDQVHRGAARRRRRRRAAASGVGVASVVAVAVLGSTTVLLDPSGEESAASKTGSPDAAERTAASPGPLKSGSGPTKLPRRTGPSSPPVPVPANFEARSVTAMSPDAFWVLGSAACNGDPCTAVARTTDGGRTFTGLPKLPAPLSAGKRTARTVTDLRFGNAKDGFAYGGALWSTHDGGRTWSAADLPGKVTELETAGGAVFALVRRGGAHQLFRSPVSGDSWRAVGLPVALDGGDADLALPAGAVTVTGSSGGRAVTLVSSDGGRSFRSADRPCAPELDAEVSAVGDALWMFCATGTEGRPYVSGDAGGTWRAVNAAPRGGWASATVVGARTADAAVLGSGGALYAVSADGGTNRLDPPRAGQASRFRFIGFSTAQIGYAVTDRRSAALWRTTDGGRTWTAVRVR